MPPKRNGPTATKQVRAPAKKAAPRKSSKAALDGRRTELVRAAYELIADAGLEGLRTRDIAARVGINIATLHYYFETKEELVASVVDHMMELFQSVYEPLPEDASALEQLRHLFTTQSYRRRVEPMLEIVVQEMMLRGRRDERVRARLELMLLAWNGYVESIVARGVRAGDFARDVDPKLTAGIVTSYLIGTNLQYGVRPGSYPLEATYTSLIGWLLPK